MAHRNRRPGVVFGKAMLLGFLLVALTTGCSGDFSLEPPKTGSQTEALAIGVETEVFSGDQVVDPEGDANIRVRHEEEGDRKFVTLLSGSADLIKSSSKDG